MLLQRRYLFSLLFLFLGCIGVTVSQPLSVDFKQAANNHSPNALGEVYWINSIVQHNNSAYYEGMSVPQRLMFTNVPATNMNMHTLRFTHQASKNGKHAYDFLTSYNQALAASSAIGGPTILVDLNECGPATGPPSSTSATCASIRSGPYSYTVNIPDAMGTVLSHNVATRVANYESRFGNRTIKIYGNAAIYSASLSFGGYGSGQEAKAEYTLTWSSASTTILVELAGHLAMGLDAAGAGTGIGYGGGLGAGSIPGSSFHFSLNSLDAVSLGNRDNQIMGSAVGLNIACDVGGPDIVCAGTQIAYAFNTSVRGLTYSWSLSNNTSGASIAGSSTGQSVVVNAGNGQGGFILTVSVSDGTQTVTCPFPVTINAVNATSSPTPILCHGSNSEVTVAATGGSPPYTGVGKFNRGAGKHDFVVTDANGCSSTTSVTITEPPLCTISVVATPILCNGGTSTVTVTASGGTPPYTGTGTFTRSAGTFSFTISDANNCTATTSVTIAQPPAGLTASSSATPILCNGSTSTVTVTATGGAPPYTGTGTFVRSAGTYSFTVTDANGCTATTQSLTITAPPTLTASASATPVSCGGSSTVTVSATGGTPPYAGTGTFSRTAGTYTFTVTDANNCSATASVTIVGSSQMSVSSTATPILCYGGTSTVTITATGGTAPYTGTGAFQRGAGTYTFTVTDANQCAGTTTITITEPAVALTASSSATPILCNGNTSTVTVTAAGGTPPYTGTGTFVRSAGTYSFSVTDANGCTATTQSLTITAPPTLTASASATPVSCGGSSTVTVSATGGTPPYAGTGTFSRTAGTYTFTVTDANNCSATASVTIVGSSQMSVSSTATPILCYGGTSTVTITATGGTAPYTGTGVFQRGAGTYTFTVTDANQCSGTTTITITGPAVALTASSSATPILCNGNTSTVTVAAAGGTPPYTGTGTFSRTAGTYTFTVTDANGCTATTQSLTITAPPTLTASANATPILCYGSNSTVTVTATGGTAPYTGTGVFSRTAGTYTFTVTDANNCSATASVTIVGSSQMSVSSTATPILCYGGTSTVTITATGGTAPYTGTGAFQRGAGTYTFTVTDANQCAGTTTITITEPAVALTASSSATPILCNGNTSTVTVTAAGGTPPYTGTGAFSRTAGTYTFTVTDANGCTATTQSLTITAPPTLAAAANATPILCYGSNSTVTVTATGGTAPYTGTGVFNRTAGTYSFTVTDANNCTATVSVNITQPPTAVSATSSATPVLCSTGNSTVTVAATGGTAPYTGTGVFSRPPGTYTFTVTDANNCPATTTITIVGSPQLNATASATPILCNGNTSTVTVAASGGTAPYTGTGAFVRGAGTFSFTVTDANNCTAIASVTIIAPPTLSVTAVGSTILCNGDTSSVTVAATGGTAPYTGVGTFRRVAGSYNFSVTDANNCTATVSVNITQPPTAVSATSSATPVSCTTGNATITVAATGGTPPYSGTGVFSRPPGTYTFTVTDANNCAATTTITIVGSPQLNATASATPILCNGNTSIVTVAASGGVAPYTGTGVFIRGAGTFSFTVTDANNCTAIASVTITAPPTLTAAASATPILCNGTTTTVTVTATGGTPPYAGTGAFVRGAGTFSFTVTDVNNCTSIASVNITQPPLLTATSSATPISCFGGNSTVTVGATGGTPPYTGTGVFSRPAGTYIFTVTDANNCPDTTSVTITGAPQLIATASATPILCNGSTTTVTVTAIGGTAPYTGTGGFIRGAGTFSFTVTDANNCSAIASVTITQPPALSVAAIGTPILCHGDTSSITVTATGGTAPFVGVGTFRRAAGSYNFAVTDANGCTATASMIIAQPPQLIADVDATPILCNGDTSTVDVTATGGMPPYSGTGRFSRRPGTYSFIVTDANSCRDTVELTLTEPTPLNSAASFTPILCYGGNSTVTVTANGGTPPYSGVGNFSRPAGTHVMTVTDANGCLDTTVVTITQPPALVPAATGPPILCHGYTTTITVTASGGTPPYTGTGVFIRGAGTYTFPVTDANGCIASVVLSIPDPPQLFASSFATPILCKGDTSVVTITAYGGTQPYSGTGVFRRGPGSFTFIVTDANGCTALTSVTITEPPLLIAASTATPILCKGGTSTVTVTASGGTPPYLGTGNFIRTAGTYNFAVTDSNGCTAVTSINITEPPALVVSAIAAPVLCHSDSTTVTVTASGGTPPYTGVGSFRRTAGSFFFSVTDANNCSVTASVIIGQPPQLVAAVNATPILCHGDTSTIDVTATGGTMPYSGTGRFGRGPGRHVFVVTDANGCIDTVAVTLVEPPLLLAAATFTPILCHGGSSTVTITATGGTPPYTGVGNFSRPAGTHVFTVTDANNCLDTTVVTITEPPAIVVTATATPILCHGGTTTITVTASGGTPGYTGTGVFIRLAGTYTFTVTDANNCTAMTVISIPDPPQLFAASFATPILCFGDSSTVTITAYGGTQPYSGTGIFRRGPGSYSFIVTDGNGCTALTSVLITEPPLLLAASTATPILCNGGNTTITVTASGGTPPYTGTGNFIRPAGTHIFTVRDSNGCIATTSITVLEPTRLVVSATAPPVLCGKDPAVVTVTASGGTPPYSGTGTFYRTLGTYIFVVTDANGCTASDTVTVTGPPPLVAAAVHTPILCNGGISTVTVSATGGTPPYMGTGTYLRAAGTHTFFVRDQNNCADTVQITISEPPPLVVICNVTPCENGVRTVSAFVHGGTPPYTYNWTPGNINTPIFTVPCHDLNTYTLIVRDANWNPNDPYNAGCQGTCMVSLLGIKPDDPKDEETARSGDGRTGRGSGNEREADPSDSDRAFGSSTRTQKSSDMHPANEYALFENYPNPFNPSTTIRYHLPEASYVRLTIVNSLGRTIATLVDENVEAGTQMVTWNATADQGSPAPSGSYFYRIHATSLSTKREFVRERLMLLLR